MGSLKTKVIEAIIQREGEFVDHPDDRGGPTKYGVTIATARAFGYHGEIKDMPKSFAFDVYQKEFWENYRFDRLVEICPALAEKMADVAVHMGPYWPVDFLQKSLNVLNQKTKLYRDLRVDGVIGPITIGALVMFKNHRGDEGLGVLYNMITCLQGARYIDVTVDNEDNESFVYGWFKKRINILV